MSPQAIDFLLASSIQDGCPLLEMFCSGEEGVGEEEGEEEEAMVFLSHILSSRSASLPGILVGLDSEQLIEIND